MIKTKIEDFLLKKQSTLLCVGPMSKNCVDACLEISKEKDILLVLIASRRQVDDKFFGGGYVNNWDTENFAKYVFENDKVGNLILARDHGGPWQSDFERKNKLGLHQAMDSAKLSYKADIDAGFKILHIDPSIDIHKKPSTDEILLRIYELYEYCWSYAKKNNKEIIFEIGTEEQTGSSNSLEELDYTLSNVIDFCRRNKLPKPTFVVAQTGTRVMETRNVGSFDNPLRILDEIPAEIQIPRIVDICNKYKVFLKEHNADYISDDGLKWHPRLGIHAANIAPEFGVAESIELLKILEEYGLKVLADSFLKKSYESRKWNKWMVGDNIASKRQKSIIAGHYVFASSEIKQLKIEAQKYLLKKGIDLDICLKEAVKVSINRYIKNFRIK